MSSNNSKFTKMIIEVTGNEIRGLLILIVGVFLAGVCLIFSAMGKSGFPFFGGIFISALGIFSAIIGFYVSVHYAHKYSDLLKELEHTQQ
jgi:hypothetical protein